MKISSKLPQFIEKEAIIFILSRQNGKIFIAKDGIIDILDEFSVEKPRFLQRAGMFFKRKGKGKIVGASAIRENIKENLQEELIKKFKESLAKIFKNNKKFDFVYLFASPHTIGDARSILEDDFMVKLDKVVEGNYIKSHPFKLLEKIAE